MTHYLSEVTHLRLEQREPIAESDASVVQHTHDFTGQMRCACVAEKGKGIIEVWSGSIDGGLDVRRGLNGYPFKNLIPKPVANVHVHALCALESQMWVGFSTGQIAVYDTKTFNKMHDKRAHHGVVTALFAVDGQMFSGGCDWQVYGWNSLFTKTHQFSGHTNGVRCLTGLGDSLYSGGDDGLVFSWHLHSNMVKEPLWPIKAHDASVRAMAVNSVYLFTSSNDGTLKVWNTQTAQLVRILDERAAVISSLFVETACRQLWAGSSDGVISVFDTETLTTHAVLPHHRTANVALVLPVARANSLKMWSVTSKGVRFWYVDSDLRDAELNALIDMENELQVPVETFRQRIVHNYNQLELCKSELKTLEERDVKKKEDLAAVLGRDAAVQDKRTAVARLSLWLRRLELARSREDASVLCYSLVEQDHRMSIFRKWQRFTWHRSIHNKRRTMEKLVTNISNGVLQRQFVDKLTTYSEACARKAASELKATTLARSTERSVVASYFMQWSLFHQQQMTSMKATAAQYIEHKLRVDAAETEDAHQKRLQAVDRFHRERQEGVAASLNSSVETALLSRYMTQWSRQVLSSRRRRTQESSSSVLAQVNNMRIIRECFQKMSSFPSAKRLECTSHQLQDTLERIAYIEDHIAENAHSTEEALEQELRRKQLELVRLMEQNAAIDATIATLQRQKRSLQRAALREVTVDKSTPIVDQLSKAMFFLKARGASTFFDVEEVVAAKALVKEQGVEKTMSSGIAGIRRVCARLIKPEELKEKSEPEWFVGDLLTKLKKKSVLRCATFLVRIVTAFDSVSQDQLLAWTVEGGEGEALWSKKHKFNDEIVSNIGILVEIAQRSYRYRRNEDPITGLAKSKAERPLRKVFVGRKAPKKIVKKVKKQRKTPANALEQ